jgi:SAM-dependent methyltransferase
MVTDPYGDRDLVPLYDVDNPGGGDHDFYRALADTLDARRIVDLGCGTGLLTRRLARAGRSVTGIDPSPTMLDWARRQPGADAVTWLEGDATSIPPTGDVDLVLCSGNAIMHLDTNDLATASRRIRDGLRPGGVLSFETRNPAAREWEEWTRQATYGNATPTSGCWRSGWRSPT